ncbi:hypothetical protein AB0911_12010 [Streptomyces nigra]|uniref:DUF6907 domain-containing protein n=1 Tax=Streptomyces nigra TaxID=1827580 RepID=UPI003453B3E6
MTSPELTLASACPPWCAEDHTGQAGDDRDYHAASTRELRLPDGRVVLDVTLVREPGEPLPQLAVSAGALTALLDQVALLDDAEAAALEGALVALARHVRRGRQAMAPARLPGGAER